MPIDTCDLVVDACQISNWDDEVFHELVAGGVTCVQATCAVWENTRDALHELSAWQQRFRAHADLIRPARSVEDIRAARAEGRVAFVLGFQNTSPVEDDLSLVEQFHVLGVRVMQLTYNIQNLVGGSCYEPTDSGLTRFGKLVVAEMNRVGMLVDLSHVGERTSLDAIEASERPVGITHANPRWFYDSPRNKSDFLLKELAAAGGVLGCTMYPPFIGGASTTLADFCGMVEQLCESLGPEHVAIGSDLTRKWPDAFVSWLRDGRWRHGDGQRPSWPQWPSWFSSAADFPAIVDGLRQRGLLDEHVALVMGGNWLRLFGETFGERAG